MVKKSDLLKTKTDRPLRIFISYGHPDAEICMRIRNVLCMRGHEVWFDLDDIKTGDDWRRSITEGIRQSQSVLSMLSRHSVRDPGVCLDEMRIAIGIRGGNIRTILLEPEGRVEPPATLSDRQWLDMSDWKQKKEDQAWFDEKMILLISAIESPENVRFAGEIERIRRALPDLRYDTSRQSALLRQPFYGRTWLVEKINAWRMDPQGARMCILYGDPGIGKSAFTAYYTHYFVYGAAAVFCEFSRPGFNDPRAVIQTLAYLLACRFPDYRLLLCDLLEESSLLSSMNASEQFDLLIANPFSSILIDGGRGAQCIVIDGLDECGTAEKNVVTEVLVQYADRLPDWLRVLATSRRVAGVTGPASGTFHIDMHGDDRENIRDVEEFFQRQLVPSVTSEICSSLARKSGGIFLYAVMMLDAVRRGRLDPSHPEICPEGLGSAFFRWFQWFFSGYTQIRRMLRTGSVHAPCLSGAASRR
ncbi:MAG: toll/interleukin-1 receptor domain-containing protein [Eubacteriales bacterium]|nr:toll/interleukin-1 receptor domain-containing protein [Eubacteriales bacterium]